MGNMHAQEFSDLVADGQIGLKKALVYHLTVNHFPPLPYSMVPVCQRAISKAKSGKWDAKVRLPGGCSYKGSEYAPVDEIVRAHHLDAFIS